MIYDNTYIKPYDECIECLTKEFIIEQLNKLTDTSKDLIASKIVELDASNYYKSTYIDILHQRIDKAIEYIGLNEEDLKLYDIYDVNGIELFKILRGNNEESKK